MKYTWFGNNYETYKPKRNKVKVGLLLAFCGLLLATPCTNWILAPTTKVISKNMGWMYR